MMCFRDRTYCDAPCDLDPTCPRRLTDEVRTEARRWWGKDDPPIATSDLRECCSMFKRAAAESTLRRKAVIR